LKDVPEIRCRDNDWITLAQNTTQCRIKRCWCRIFMFLYMGIIYYMSTNPQ